MTKELIQTIVMAASLLLGVFCIIRFRKVDKAQGAAKGKRKRFLIIGVLSIWLGCGLAIGRIPSEASELHVSIFAPRWSVFGVSMNSSVVMAVVATLLIAVLCLIIRIFIIPKFKEKPTGIQTVLETAVDELSKYTKEKAPTSGDSLNAYMMAIALLLIMSAILELFAFRPPTADLITTFSLALCTFFLINYYGIKEKGAVGRIKSYGEPIKILYPFKILSDIANPVSLASRLFGNMLGGMIVIELVYMALGSFGVGIPAVLGLYFNIFHPLIQTFIFITLSLTFIREATEKEG